MVISTLTLTLLYTSITGASVEQRSSTKSHLPCMILHGTLPTLTTLLNMPCAEWLLKA
jgi:hypothetical protein